MSDTGTLFWNQVIWSSESLDATEVLLLLALADHVDAEDRAFPGVERLASRARCSYATARRRLKGLEERGMLERSRRRNSSGNLSTYEYRFLREGFGLSIPSAQIERLPSLTQVSASHRSPGERAEVPSIEVPSNELSPPTESNGGGGSLFNDGESASVEKPDLLAEEFEAWWQIVPRKISKGNARKAYAKARKAGVSSDRLITSMIAFAESVKDREAQFIPHPATWLNGERWDDEIEDPDGGWNFGSGPMVG